MKTSQSGFGLVFIIVSLAILAIMAGLYFTNTNDNASPYDNNQDAVQRAREINQQKLQESQAVQRQLELKNELEGN